MTAKRITALLLCLTAILFTSCKENKHNESKEIKDVSIEEARKSVSSICNLELKKITFDENTEISIPDRLYDSTYICPSGFEKDYEQIFSHYVSDYDSKKIDNAEGTYPTGPSYIDEDKGLTMSVGCTGFFSYFRDFDWNMISDSEVVKSFSIEEAKNSPEKYKLVSGDDVLISDALKYAEDFADDFIEFTEYPNKVQPSRITLYKSGDSYYYYIDFVQSVSDIDILGYFPEYDTIDEKLVVPGCSAYVCSDELNVFTMVASFNEYESNGEIDKIPDPVQTAEYLDDSIAANMKLKAGRIALSYMMINTGNIQETDEDSLTDREAAPWAVFCSYDTFKAVPCWVFYFDETFNKEVYAVVTLDEKKVYFVNNWRE